MMSIREIKNKARRDLHDHAEVPAIYISPLQNAVPRPITVRVHSKFANLGLLNRDDAWAETREIKPRVVVLREQLPTPRQNGVFSLSPEEAYRVDVVEQPDGITITCVCVALTRQELQAATYPVP